MPSRRAASRPSATPSTVSWSVRASSSTPERAAAATTAAGASSPSEQTECACRSNAGGMLASPAARVLELAPAGVLQVELALEPPGRLDVQLAVVREPLQRLALGVGELALDLARRGHDTVLVRVVRSQVAQPQLVTAPGLVESLPGHVALDREAVEPVERRPHGLQARPLLPVVALVGVLGREAAHHGGQRQ